MCMHLQAFLLACLHAESQELAMLPPEAQPLPPSSSGLPSEFSSIFDKAEGVISPRRDSSPSVRAGASQSEGSRCWAPRQQTQVSDELRLVEPRKPVTWLSFCPSPVKPGHHASPLLPTGTPTEPRPRLPLALLSPEGPLLPQWPWGACISFLGSRG